MRFGELQIFLTRKPQGIRHRHLAKQQKSHESRTATVETTHSTDNRYELAIIDGVYGHVAVLVDYAVYKQCGAFY